MSQTTLNLVAITIFTLVMTSLLGPLLHLSPFVPAVATFGILSVATLDTLSWRGQVGNLVVDWFASFSAEHRARVVQHEAGHFLAAHLLEIPVTGYALSAWEAFRQGQPGRGGVSFALEPLELQLQQGQSTQLSTQLLDRFCTVWMAGIAAEQLTYGNAEGGGDDRLKLRLLWSQLKRPDSEGALKERWALLQAKTLLESNRAAYDALVTAMAQRVPVEACKQLIEQHQATDTNDVKS
ncbi:MAG: ATP-dependent Zn protease [Leptolyngbya sp. IPPAS B-1204]|nr:ATP-dependent Zn protease [Elainella sp. C42_A2020_010]RNJ69744.1 MAG: ATP-dependent Zn protease [Leptolyngbya sp. IPPAS B-1204]